MGKWCDDYAPTLLTVNCHMAAEITSNAVLFDIAIAELPGKHRKTKGCGQMGHFQNPWFSMTLIPSSNILSLNRTHFMTETLVYHV